ncbi:MAG: DUF1289 domain-containing protein [Pseudomonadota bacterium]
MLTSDTYEPVFPCKKVCKLMDNGQICASCGTTLDEIAEWSSFSASRKVQVIDDATPHMREMALAWSE